MQAAISIAFVEVRDLRLENAIDDVATYRSSGTEYSSVAHLLAKLLSVLFEFTVFSTRVGTFARCGSDNEWHIAVLGRWRAVRERPLLVDDIDIATWEDPFKACAFVPTPPP